MNMAGGLSAVAERPLMIHSEMGAVSFGIDLQAAQLITASGGLGVSLPDVPLDDQATLDISENPSPAEHLIWLGVTLPLAIELRVDESVAGTENDSIPMSRAELTRLISDFTGASENRAISRSGTDERPQSPPAQTWAAHFEIDLPAAGHISVPESLGTLPPDVPLNDPDTLNISDNPSPAEQVMWQGSTLPIPIEQRPLDAVTGNEADSRPISVAKLTHLNDVRLHLVGKPHEELSADYHSVSIDPVTIESPTLAAGHQSTPETQSPAAISPYTTMSEGLLADQSLDNVRLPMDDPTPDPPSVQEEPRTFDAPAADAENIATVDRLTGFASIPRGDVPPNILQAATLSSHTPGATPVKRHTELSEVVRHVRTMVTKHETRSTIQLEPAELGRLTLELVDAPKGLRAHVSAEDPAVLRFLERNVQLLETEARWQGVGHITFSVGADVSGGLGRGDQRPSEAEETFRQNILWNATSHVRPRSRRELDTSA